MRVDHGPILPANVFQLRNAGHHHSLTYACILSSLPLRILPRNSSSLQHFIQTLCATTMLNVVRIDPGEVRSGTSCHVCRKRKVRCGRELPRCLVCEQSSQKCEYPERVKPGPRIGTSQKNRKRPRQNQDAEKSRSPRRRRQSQGSTPGPTDEIVNQAPGSTSQSSSPADLRKLFEHIQPLSFIMHPSHESCSADRPPHRPVWTPPRHSASQSDEPLVTASCYALGITPDILTKL